MAPSITVFGLGLMGRPIARRLLAHGFQVGGWNRSALAPALVSGIPVRQSLADGAGAGVCLLMLVDSAATDAVLAGLEPHLHEGQIVLDMGSSDPARSRAHAARLSAKGIGWVDAPVSGGPEGAARRDTRDHGGGRRA